MTDELPSRRFGYHEIEPHFSEETVGGSPGHFAGPRRARFERRAENMILHVGHHATITAMG
jgi:hypothetical protein